MSPTLDGMKDAFWVGPLTMFVMAGTFFSAGGHDGLTAWQWGSVLIAALACLALVLWRQSADVTVLVVGGLVGLYLALGYSDGPVYLSFFVASFLGARVLPVRRWLPTAGVAVAALLVGMAIRAVTTELGWWHLLGQSTVVVAIASAAAAIGSMVRSRAQTDTERMARAATEEQLRMAQDLHDGVGHGLAVIAMQAGVALHVLERDPAAARSALEAIRGTSKESLDSLRAELSKLSGEAPRTPRRRLADVDVLVERMRATGLEVDVRRTGEPRQPLPPDVDAATYMIVQESLTNVLRHASARLVVVGISVEVGLTLTVTDDGRGGPVNDEGMGLRGMRERAEALGGTLSAGPRPGGGFEVIVELPL
jgi:signal transduction histidine kinase